MAVSLSRLPEPAPRPGSGHLQDWARRPLPLLEQGAQAARAAGNDLFRLRLGRAAVVGFSPAWNRQLLSDLGTFVSAGSFSQVVPYLAGGIILTDAPEHRKRRQLLNPGFTRAHLQRLEARLEVARPTVPGGEFDALHWADDAVLHLLNAAFFSAEFPLPLLRAFLSPLRRPFPVPALPRPLLFTQVNAELRRLAQARQHGERNDLLAFLAPLPGGLTEARVSLAAAHDTTTHALAYALWFAARFPQWHRPERHPALLKEVLRLYPPGWMGSRKITQDTDWKGILLKNGTLALYSPYLSGQDPARWENAAEFHPERWSKPPPAWTYLPFGGGERTCLGMHLAQTLILDVLAELPPLRAHWGHDEPHPGITLGPRGPLVVERR